VWGHGERARCVSAGADTKATLSGGGALESEILVPLRMAASAEAPLSPIQLSRRLQARDVEGVRCESQHVNGR